MGRKWFVGWLQELEVVKWQWWCGCLVTGTAKRGLERGVGRQDLHLKRDCLAAPLGP